jgi:hypothetical protein
MMQTDRQFVNSDEVSILSDGEDGPIRITARHDAQDDPAGAITYAW